MIEYVELEDRGTGAVVTLTVYGDEEAARTEALSRVRDRYYDDEGNPLPEQPDWIVTCFGSSRLDWSELPRVPPAEPPAEWEMALESEAEPAASSGMKGSIAGAPAPRPSDGKGWNALLAADGLSAIQSPNLSREVDVRLRQRPQRAAFEKSIRDQEGLGTLVEVPFDEPRRRGAGRPPSAMTVTADGQKSLQAIKSDTTAIAAWLNRDDRLATYQDAMRRGRPTSARSEARSELAGHVEELLTMGATATAIAAVLKCGREAVGGLRARRAA